MRKHWLEEWFVPRDVRGKVHWIAFIMNLAALSLICYAIVYRLTHLNAP